MTAAFDLIVMQAQASLETRLADAKAGLADAKGEIAVFNRPKAEQDLAWPEGPPVPLITLHERVRRLERTIGNLELALGGADDLAAAK